MNQLQLRQAKNKKHISSQLFDFSTSDSALDDIKQSLSRLQKQEFKFGLNLKRNKMELMKKEQMKNDYYQRKLNHTSNINNIDKILSNTIKYIDYLQDFLQSDDDPFHQSKQPQINKLTRQELIQLCNTIKNIENLNNQYKKKMKGKNLNFHVDQTQVNRSKSQRTKSERKLSRHAESIQYPDDEQMIAACKDFLKTIKSMKGLERLSKKLDEVGLGQDEIVFINQDKKKKVSNLNNSKLVVENYVDQQQVQRQSQSNQSRSSQGNKKFIPSCERFSPDKGYNFKQRALDLEKDFARCEPDNYLIRSDTLMLTRDQANEMFRQIQKSLVGSLKDQRKNTINHDHKLEEMCIYNIRSKDQNQKIGNSIYSTNAAKDDERGNVHKIMSRLIYTKEEQDSGVHQTKPWRYQCRPFTPQEVIEYLDLAIQNLGNYELCQVFDFVQTPLDASQIQKLSDDQWVYLMIHSNLVFCPYFLWLRSIQKPEVMYGVVQRLFEKMKNQKKSDYEMQFQVKITKKTLEDAIIQSDKNLYIKFRNGELTYDQLRARTSEKNGTGDYVVLDDFRHKLNKDILDGLEGFEKTFQRRFMQPDEPLYSSFKVIEEQNKLKLQNFDALSNRSNKMKSMTMDNKKFMQALTKQPEDWEMNSRCIRSIKYHHQKQVETIFGQRVEDFDYDGYLEENIYKRKRELEEKKKFKRRSGKILTEDESLAKSLENYKSKSKSSMQEKQTEKESGLQEIINTQGKCQAYNQLVKEYRDVTEAAGKDRENAKWMKLALQAIEKNKEQQQPTEMQLINMHLGEKIIPSKGNHIDAAEVDNLYRLLKIKQDKNIRTTKSQSNIQDKRDSFLKDKDFQKPGPIPKMPTESQLEDILREKRTTEPGTQMSSIKVHYYNQTSKHLRFLQQFMSDGNTILISDKHKDVLKIRDSIGEAISKDLRDAGYNSPDRNKSFEKSQYASQISKMSNGNSEYQTNNKNGVSRMNHSLTSRSDSDSPSHKKLKKNDDFEMTPYQLYCQDIKRRRQQKL